jgi:hypothetical protein
MDTIIALTASVALRADKGVSDRRQASVSRRGQSTFCKSFVKRDQAMDFRANGASGEVYNASMNWLTCSLYLLLVYDLIVFE